MGHVPLLMTNWFIFTSQCFNNELHGLVQFETGDAAVKLFMLVLHHQCTKSRMLATGKSRRYNLGTSLLLLLLLLLLLFVFLLITICTPVLHG